MPTRTFTSGRIRQVEYDARQSYLEVRFDDQRIVAYRPVAQEIFERLCRAPNPMTYYEDRIAEECPSVTPNAQTKSDDQRAKGQLPQGLKDLFGN